MRRLVMVLAGLALSACARMGMGSGDEATMVSFRNESSEQAGVYVVGTANESTRIGTVSGGDTQQLRIPDDFVRRGTVSFYVRLLARRETPASGRVNLQPGDRLQVTLPASLGTLAVLPGS